MMRFDWQKNESEKAHCKMPRKQKNNGAALGKALKKRTGLGGNPDIQSTYVFLLFYQRKQHANFDCRVGKHVAKADGGDAMNSLESYLEGTSLDDFLANAVLSGREFVAERQNIIVLEGQGKAVLTEK